MKVFKITNLILCISLTLFLIISACIPGSSSSKQSGFVGKIIGNAINGFFKDKITYTKSIEVLNLKENYAIGDVFYLETVITPQRASYSSLTYSSSDESVIMVNSLGEVKTINEGNATITITQKESNVSKSVALEVLKVLPTDITIELEDKVNAKSATEIICHITPSNTTNKNITFRSSNEEIAIISNGVLYAKKSGTVTIYAKVGNMEKSKNIEVMSCEEILMSEIQIDDIEKVTVGENKEINYLISPNSVTNDYLFWESSDEEIATVSKGIINPKKPGIVTITAYNYERTISKSITITCKNYVSNFDFENEEIPIGETTNLKIFASSYTYPYFTCSSSNEEIASFNEDKSFTTKNYGTTDITITYDDGIDYETHTFTITVVKQTIYEKVNNFDYLIRKLVGHFGAFFALGIFSFISCFGFIKSKKKQILICIIYGFAIAAITELIQLGIDNRAGQIKDIFIDYAGYAMSFILAFLIYFKRWRKE